MKEWFAQLNQRDQMSLLVLGIVLVLYLFYLFVWSPLDTKRDELAGRRGDGARCGGFFAATGQS